MILTRVNMAKHAGQLANRVIYFTLESPPAAKRLVNRLVTSPNDRLIVPFIDHPGPMTDEILSRNLKSLTFCDRNDKKLCLFQRYLMDNFPNRNIQLFPEDVFDLSFKEWSDSAQQRCSEIVNSTLVDVQLPTDQHHHCDTITPRIKFLVPLLKSRNESSFLKNIYFQYAKQIGLCSQTYINYYFLISDRMYAYLSAKPSVNLQAYRSSTILYNTMFNIEKIDSFNLQEAFQITLNRIQKTAPGNKNIDPKVHLISLEPNLQFLHTVDSKTILEFTFFINQMMMRRTWSAITFLDKWFDDCSEIVKPLGISEKMRAGDLDKHQYLELFMCFRNRTKYRDSTFLEAVTTQGGSL